MAIIAYWSSTKKQTGQSMSLAAVATDMAIEHNHKILIISTQYDDNTLELCFGSQDKNKKLINKLVGTTSATSVDNGIEGLARMAVSGRMTPEIIQNYTHVIYRNRLEILYGYKKNPDRPSEEEYLKIKEKYKEIIQNAARAYDIVFVDLNKTSEDSVVKDILEIADVIVYNVEQKINMINEFEEIREKLDNKKKNNVILNIGRFDQYSKYTIKNISRYLKIKRDIIAIPYNTLYFEAASEENVSDLFLKLRGIDETERNGSFMKLTKEAGEKIIYKLQELQMRM